jgi:predicted transcriptional regulator
LIEFGLYVQVLGQKVDFEFGYSTRLIRAARRGDTVIYVEPFEW